MKRASLITAMVVSVAAVISASLVAAHRQRVDLWAQFERDEGRRCTDAAKALEARLASAVRDAQFLVHLTDETRRRSDLARRAQDRELAAAFQALATSVAHYRTIAAFSGEGIPRAMAAPTSVSEEGPPVVVHDPTETAPEVLQKLVAESAAFASRRLGATQGSVSFSAPLPIGPRTFYLLGLSAGGQQLVISLDAPLLFSGLLPAASTDGRVRVSAAVVDPAGVAWLEDGPVGRPVAEGTAPLKHLAPGDDPRLFLRAAAPSAMPALEIERQVALPFGRFRLLMASATDALVARQRAGIVQLLLTTGGVVAALVFFGTRLLRQLARAARLAERLATAEEIAHLKERSDKILANAPLGIAGLKRDGRAVFLNQYLRERARTARDESSDSRAAWVVKAWLQALHPWVAHAVLTQRPFSPPPKELPALGGLFQDMEVQIVPLVHPIDELEVLVLMRDVSEIRELERHLVRAEKLVTVGALSAGLAHEIGTPLMVIRGKAEDLRDMTRSQQEKSDLGAIIAQIDRIAAIVRQVLDFARAEPLATAPTDAASVAREAVDLVGWRARKRRVTVHIDAEEGLPPLRAHRGQLEQVFVNLISNACDASAEGQEVEVKLARAGAKPGFLRLEVEDKGHGIPPELIHAVFDPYFTTKAQGEGVGLGLAVVGQIVRAHGGEISLMSAPGRGTTAIISWPLA